MKKHLLVILTLQSFVAIAVPPGRLIPRVPGVVPYTPQASQLPLTPVAPPQAPIGEALLGRSVGDQIEIEIQKRRRDYDIVSVW